MFEFTVVHKYCGFTKAIKGYSVYDALKTNNLDLNIWIVKNVEKI